MKNAATTDRPDHLTTATALWVEGKKQKALAYIEREFAAGRMTQYQLRVIEGVLGV